ncbi:helix-hairpin-helix domain-containing protein [Patescibacteria group bacterium]|nr:helix-hairpin-helix domain-containing protein [Patescibacteria group bacterium]MCL5409303.1 helix-hairpin-helix domain-containing protein [Patescibacteria group bacterium]
MEESPLDQFISHYKLPIILSAVGGVLLVSGIISSGLIPKTLQSNPSQPIVLPTANPQMSQIMVDVSGAVKHPGVYQLTSGARVEDAIQKAGGLTTQADTNYVAKTLNLAQKVTDGLKIYIPNSGESSPAVAGATVDSTALGTININSASLDTLDSLPGVGPVTAQKIVDNRPYSQTEDLVTKKVVGKSEFDKIKDKISVY